MIDDFARRINAAPGPKAAVYVAGGGTEVFPMVLTVGGGSATLLAGRIPYDPSEFRAILGYDPGRLVDEQAARGLATAAFRHAQSIRGESSPDQVFGVGASSKLSRIEGERRGRQHEIHVAMQTTARTLVRSVVLPEGTDRAWEERINALMILNLIARGKGLTESMRLEFGGVMLPESTVSEVAVSLEDIGGSGLDGVLTGHRSWVALDINDGRFEPKEVTVPRLLLPGSFRPVHEGHLAMAQAASELKGVSCSYEISISHPDKPALDYVAIHSRLKGFGLRPARIYFTNAPTYREKARIFPGCTFAIGHDTMVRILDPHYYGGIEARDSALRDFEALGANFLVFGRTDALGSFSDLRWEDFEGSAQAFLLQSVRTVPEKSFRVDISSTQIRAQSAREYA